MSTETQLATVQQEPSVAMMLGALIDKGVTADTVGALERLCDLKMKMDDRQAEREFNIAFNEMQGEMKAVHASKAITDRDGKPRSTFAPYEDIVAQAEPIYSRHGFSVSFNSRVDDKRITAICKLMHRGGHSSTSEFGVAISTPPGASAAQGDGSTMSYAKRYALCNALNIVIEHMDDDAKAKGSPMEEKQWEELQSRVRNLEGVSEAKFLAFAGATTFETISKERYDSLDEMLTRKEVAQGLREKDGSWK